MVDGNEQAQAFAKAREFKPTHVSHKRVEAYPIAAAEFRQDGSGRIALVGGEIVEVPRHFADRGVPAEGDMLVRYEPTRIEPEGFLSHSPRAVFDAGYLRTVPDSRPADATGAPALSQTEAAAVVETKTAPKVTEAEIVAKIQAIEYFRSRTLTICVVTMQNGFHVLGTSACASPENYDQNVGERYAYNDAFRQLWPLEGYLLRERLAASVEPPRVPRIGAQDTRSRGEPRP